MIDRRLNQCAAGSSLVTPMPPCNCTGLLADEARRLSDPGFRRRNGLRAGGWIVARQTRGRETDDGTRLLRVNQHIDHAMLQRLKHAIGTPNCCRSLVYSTVARLNASSAPSASAHSRKVA